MNDSLLFRVVVLGGVALLGAAGAGALVVACGGQDISREGAPPAPVDYGSARTGAQPSPDEASQSINTPPSGETSEQDGGAGATSLQGGGAPPLGGGSPTDAGVGSSGPTGAGSAAPPGRNPLNPPPSPREPPKHIDPRGEGPPPPPPLSPMPGGPAPLKNLPPGAH